MPVPAPERERETEVVYHLGRNGRDASTYCKDLEALTAFLPNLAPGDYWIRRCLARREPGGYRDPVSAVEWGVVRVEADGRFTLRSIAPETRPTRNFDDHLDGRFDALDVLPNVGRNS